MRRLLLCLAFVLLLPNPCFPGQGYGHSLDGQGDTYPRHDFTQIQPGDTFNPVAGGAINTRTGEFFPKSGPGLVVPRTGEYMPTVPGGVINPRTGFNPMIPRNDGEDRE